MSCCGNCVNNNKIRAACQRTESEKSRCDKQCRCLRGCGSDRQLGEYIRVAIDTDTDVWVPVRLSVLSVPNSGAFFSAVCTVVRLSLCSHQSRTAFVMLARSKREIKVDKPSAKAL